MTGFLEYNNKNNRFGFLVMDLWKIDGFHCGDTFEVWDYDTEEWKEDRIEFDWAHDEWYLVNLGLSGDYICGLKIRV